MLYDLHGKLISEQEKLLTLKAHSLILLNKVELPKIAENVFFLKLLLTDKDITLDENLYWLSNKPHSYEKLNELDKVTLKTTLNTISNNQTVINISNPGNETAFFIRLKICNQNNELALPVFLTENYFTLLPGENKIVELDYSQVKVANKTDELKLVVEGWNIVPEEKKF